MKRNKALKGSTAANHAEQEIVERPAFPQALLDHFISNYKRPSDLIGENGML